MRVLTRGALRALALLAGALAWAAAAHALLNDIVGGNDTPPPPAWQLRGLPQQKAPFTRFSRIELDGQPVLRVQADASYGYLVHAWPIGTAGRWLSWRWRVDEFNALADLRTRDGDDAALKVCVMFDLPLQAVPFTERQLLRLARARSGEALPAATLCYVWDERLPGGTLLDNPYSRRVRWIVLRGAGSDVSIWHGERRDVQADFQRAFGDESRSVPAITAIAVGADADNTRGRSLAYLSGLRLEP